MPLPPLVWQNALLTFGLSLLLGTALGFITFLPIALSLLILLVIVGLGIVFDMIGVAVAAADEEPLHAMGADRVAGSGQALWLVRRAEWVANLCNDVVGDVSNTVSGAITASLTVALAVRYSLDRNVISIAAIAAIAALNVGGKACGKVYALRNPYKIIMTVGRSLPFLGRRGTRHPGRQRNQGRR